MMTRYFIALTLDKDSDQFLRQSCQSVLNHTISIHTLHLTLIPPFYLKPSIHQTGLKVLLKTTPTLTHQVKLSNVGVFPAKKRKILYVSLTPPEKFRILHHQLITNLHDQIQFDTSVYLKNKLPTFKPHITLSYNYKKMDSAINTLHETLKERAVKLEGPHLFSMIKDSEKYWKREL